MKQFTRIWPGLALGTVLLSGLRPAAVSAQTQLPAALEGVGIDQKLDAQVPLDLPFRDEQGRTVRLGDYFGAKPVILVLAYYRCPMLCTLVLNGLTRSLLDLPFDVGKEFEVVTVSFDAREPPELAAAKKQSYLERYGRSGAEAGWHFLTGELDSIARLADAVGFHYRYDPEREQFAHASGIMVLTPTGRIARYFYGIEFPARDLRLALVEASANRIGSPVDRVLLFCFHYDPETGRYGPVVMRLVRTAGGLTAGVLGLCLVAAWRRDFRRGRSLVAKG